ncbi:hypothetical protein G5V58_04095 [Nocardioides anomalus]|uniref:Uncharacterized protein n=1 Tax=Nocardioides anomalus TaxID=2712223 RepID=A0A6G6W9N3_9ACTN|nr:hypothetical protein [Nocardioides anomalus]QIG42061.1 hypothetical protein G5V58_04095 [Nocardioides anomalus]
MRQAKRFLVGARRQIKKVLLALHRELQRLADAIGIWAQRRRDQYAADPGYAEALVRVAIAAADLLLDNRRIRSFAFQLAEALLAVLRGRGRRLDPGHGYWD